MPALDPAWIALIGTLCGGIGLKVLEHWLGKSKLKIDEAAKLRDELRVQLNDQKDEIKTLETELNTLRKEYYDLRDQHAELNTKYLINLEKLKAEAEAINKAVQGIAQTPPT